MTTADAWRRTYGAVEEIERSQSRIEAEPRRAVGTEDRVRLAHIDVECGWSCGGDTPMHLNSLTPIGFPGRRGRS